MTQTNVEVAPKRLELLHELVPTASVVALLVNPAEPALAETYTKEVQAAARTLGLKLHVLNASSEGDFDAVFAKLIQLRAGGLVIGGGPFFASQSSTARRADGPSRRASDFRVSRVRCGRRSAELRIGHCETHTA